MKELNNQEDTLLLAYIKKINLGKYYVKIGVYEYNIICHGYYAPDRCIWWEATNLKTNEADFHEHTKRDLIKTMIKELSFNHNLNR